MGYYQQDRRGLDDLRWSSLRNSEKYLIASLLEWHWKDKRVENYLHFDLIIEQMRDQFTFKTPLPLLLTENQNRAIADKLEASAAFIEQNSNNETLDVMTRRMGKLFAGYIRSLIARLIKGEDAASAEDDAVIKILLGERRMGVKAGEKGKNWIKAVSNKFEKLGFGELAFAPLFEEHVEKAKAAEVHAVKEAEVKKLTKEEIRKSQEDDELADMDIFEASDEMAEVAKKSFDAAIEHLQSSSPDWPSFISRLNSGAIAGIENATKYAAVAAAASTTAYTITKLIENHIQETELLTWEAVMPGMKSILDQYPGLKKRKSLQNYVKKRLKKRPNPAEEAPKKE